MGMMKRLGEKRGQMTVELAVAMPVLIVVAVIAVNACTFVAECATFDRVVHQAVRVHAASPAYGQDAAQSCMLVESEIRAALSDGALEVRVEHAETGMDLDAFDVTLVFHPTLFGMGLRSSVFGVGLPALTHTVTYVVDAYKPGVVV